MVTTAYWDSYKVTTAKAVDRLLPEVALALGIDCYKEQCRDLQRVVQTWQLDTSASLDSRRAGSKVEQAIMAVADGSYSNCGVLHNMVPGTVALSEDLADWVERVCKCAVFYEQVAFREGGRPVTRPDWARFTEAGRVAADVVLKYDPPKGGQLAPFMEHIAVTVQEAAAEVTATNDVGYQEGSATEPLGNEGEYCSVCIKL